MAPPVRIPALRLAIAMAFSVATGSVWSVPADRDVGATLPEPTNHVACQSPPRMVVRGKTALEPNCIYTTTVAITESDTELDCKGSVIDPGALSGYGLHIDSRGEPLINVTVRNCIVRNSNAIGIVVGWRGSDREKVERYDREEIYRRTPHQVQILNTRVDRSKGSGIYIDDYASELTMRRVTVTRSESMAVYLEHSSHRITIEESLFEDNSVAKQREAIAIDSSADNIVRRNVFRRNKAGGIFLYKNCHEHAGEDSKQTHRWQGADRNLIEANRFEDLPVGVWIGSRQSRDLRRLKCGDPYYGGKYVIDVAQGNTVRGNVFRQVARGVVVEDDNNLVEQNHFESMGEACVQVGSQPRAELLRKPVIGVEVAHNRCELRDGGAARSKGIQFLHGAIPAKR